jgi:tRNA (adenine57-N1/adenine58-N1)-methyltransferase
MKEAEINFFNTFQKKIKRTTQVVLPKDAALILAYTTLPQNALVVDAGTGTGYLAIFLAYFLPKGEIITYEKDKRFLKNAAANFKVTGLKNIYLKNKDFRKAEEKNVDLITLDLEHAEKFIDKAYKMLRNGGWLVVYSPTADSLIKVRKAIAKKKFMHVKTVENIVREWQMTKTVRPKTIGLMHTGFLTFARKAV